MAERRRGCGWPPAPPRRHFGSRCCARSGIAPRQPFSAPSRARARRQVPIPDRGFIFWFQRRGPAGAAAVGGAGRRWCRRRSSIAAELGGGCRRPPAPPRRRRGAPACSCSRFSGWISGWRAGALYPLAVAADRRGRFSNNSKTRRLLLPAAAVQLCLDESNSKERLRVSIGSAKDSMNYAVRHIMDPTRVRTAP